MKQVDYFKKYSLYALMAIGVIFTGCDDDDDVPPEENLPEIITDVTLIFTPQGGGTTVRASAQDPDGTGLADLVVQNEINLVASTTYILTYEVLNALDPDDVEDVLADDISQEKEEHQVFYSFTNDIFADPTGNGNIDNASDAINYNDFDENTNPVGFNTTWTTPATPVSGEFTALLKHQPDVKTSTSDANDGDTDFDLTFVLNIQ